MIENDNIPSQVLDEIRAAYPTADYRQYGTIDNQTKTFKLSYRSREPLTETVEIIDPVTFDPKTVDGSTHERVTMYLVRLNVEDSTIRAVDSTGTLIAPKT